MQRLRSGLRLAGTVVLNTELNTNKCPKSFGKRPHRSFVTPRCGECIRLLRALGRQLPCVCTLQWDGTCPPPQKCPFPWESGLPCNVWFLRPTLVSPLNRTSIGSAVFAQLTRVPNTQTDIYTNTHTPMRATSVAISRIYALRACDAS